ncbi:MAG: hypothetical protein FK734_10020, partial [Asgard group archaeon]|nr:hypothetical protein [Asgard group archaeon]
MRNRIDILKEIMEIEKQFALEVIDSDTFEKRMQLLERQLQETNELTDEEFLEAVNAKELPLSANTLVGRISIEDLLPTFNISRTFYRHLKIRREIVELERNIQTLEHNLHKVKAVLAEKKINPDAASVKIETLEFDLRLAQNRYGARQKYLKRNPSKGEILCFTLKNYLKFSYGHGIADEKELRELANELKEELDLRKEYQQALAEMYATIKTTQLEISSSKTKAGLPDFKQLIELQQSINELRDYISILSIDIKDYTGCLSKLDDSILEIDDCNDLYCIDDFGIDIQTTEDKKITTESDFEKKTDPFIETLEIESQLDNPINQYLVDTEVSSIPEVPDKITDEIDESIFETIKIPETPQPIYKPNIDIEIIGMEDFHLPYDINGSQKTLNELTKQVIFDSFEGYLTQLLDEDVEELLAPRKEEIPQPFEEVIETPIETQIKTPLQEESIEKIEFTSLSQDLDIIPKGQKIVTSRPLDDLIDESIVSVDEEEIASIDDLEEIEALSEEDLESLDQEQPSLEFEEASSTLPPIPPLEKAVVKTHDNQIPKDVDVTTSVEAKEVITEDLIKPTKITMISPKLLDAATEAWKLIGKALFDMVNDNRAFLGYLQEVVIYDKNYLGYILVTESVADQKIIDKIFDQIKPLWVTEELLESADKRKNYVIQEVMESLQVQKDVALHISRLQEFANFRNISYPKEEQPPKPEIIGIVPVSKIRLKRGSLICDSNDILDPQPYRTAPWEGPTKVDNLDVVGTICCFSNGLEIGKIIAVVDHPLMGKILLIDAEIPDNSLIDYLVNRLEITEKNPKERLWLVKYLIAKQLKIPEGEALTPKTIINYSLSRGFPILPNEILNSFRAFVSGGSIDKISKSKTYLKNSSRIFNPTEILPIECLRVR